MQMIKEICVLIVLVTISKTIKSQDCSLTEVCYYGNQFFTYSENDYSILYSFSQQNLSDLITIEGRTYNKNEQQVQAVVNGPCVQFERGQSIVESGTHGLPNQGLGIFKTLQQNQPNTYQNDQTIVYGQNRQYGYSPLRVNGQGSAQTQSLSPYLSIVSPSLYPSASSSASPSASPFPSPSPSPSAQPSSPSPSPSPQQFGIRRPGILPKPPPPAIGSHLVVIYPPPRVGGQEVVFGTRKSPPPIADNTIATGLDLQFQQGNEDQVRNLGIKFPPIATSYNFSENAPQVQQIIQAVNSSYQEMSNNLTRMVNNTYQQLNNSNFTPV